MEKQVKKMECEFYGWNSRSMDKTIKGKMKIYFKNLKKVPGLRSY